jgi:transposase
MLLQAFYTIRSERQLMEQLDFNLLYRWFVGLGVDDPVWVADGVHEEPGPSARG